MNGEYNLLTFKTINDFVNELTEIFGEKNHALKLYHRLLEKTTVSHDKAIEKHIQGFREFCISNRDMILNKDINKISSVNGKVQYSEKVFIDFDVILKSADRDKDEKSKEADFLTNMIEKVEENVNINSSNPLDAVTSIMSSGIFTELLGSMNTGLQDGSLDLGKLVGTVEKLCNTMSPKDGSESGGGNNINLASMLQGLNLGAMGGGSLPGSSEVINPTQLLQSLSSPKFNPDIGK